MINIPISVNIIVEGQLFVLLDIPLCKDSHANMIANGPLCDVAVWVTTVVSKTSYATRFRGIDKLG